MRLLLTAPRAAVAFIGTEIIVSRTTSRRVDEEGQKDSPFVNRKPSQCIYRLTWRKDVALPQATQAGVRSAAP
jgi:hypothetical protein